MAKRPPPESSPENSEVVSKGPCPSCDTEFGNVTYRDGHTHCFACGSTVMPPKGGYRGGGAGDVDTSSADRGEHLAADLISRRDALPAKALTSRGLTTETLAKYGYFLAGYSGKTVQVAPYYDQQSGEIVAQKARFPDKSFVAIPKGSKLNDLRLFGHHVYGDRFDRRVVVTEGEIDAMTVAQCVDFKCAVVSVNSGAAGAAKSIKANYLWLDRFEDIVLWFDDDEPGRDAASECAQLFKVGKVRIAKVPGFKDASDVMQAGKPGDVASAIHMATKYRPPGIVNAADSVEDVLAPKEGDKSAWSYDWPWTEVQDYLGPMLPGQVVYHVAGTGIGKTTGMAEVEYSLIKQGCKIAHMGFEDTRRDVKLRLMSIHVSERLDVDPRPDDEMAAIHTDFFGSRLVEMFDPETAEWTVDAILGYVRYCAKALDCRVIIIDPLTFIAAGLSLGDDERRALDKASRDLSAMAKELGVNLQIAHHLKRPDGTAHEEGAATSLNEVRGSGGIANFATTVIGHERNQQAEGDQSLLTQLRALKNRKLSRTGPMVTLKYDLRTGRLLPTTDTFPGPKGSQRRGAHAFPPIGQSNDY